MAKNQKIWKDWELNFLKNNIKSLSIKEIAEHLERTISSIHSACVEHKIYQRNPRKQIGDKIDRWLIKNIYLIKKGNRRHSMAWCQCDCGNEKEVKLSSIGVSSKSCGCLVVDMAREMCKNRITHGLTKHPLHKVWLGIKNRCYNKKHRGYKNYGGKNIVMCEEWLNDFQSFYDWSTNNGWKKSLTIERKSNDLGYNPQNCRWATMKEQSNNRSDNRKVTCFGETKNVMQWLDDPRCVVKIF